MQGCFSCNAFVHANSYFWSYFWNVNCAWATAFIFDTRIGVLVKVSNFLRQKLSRPLYMQLTIYNRIQRYFTSVLEAQYIEIYKFTMYMWYILHQGTPGYYTTPLCKSYNSRGVVCDIITVSIYFKIMTLIRVPQAWKKKCKVWREDLVLYIVLMIWPVSRYSKQNMFCS